MLDKDEEGMQQAVRLYSLIIYYCTLLHIECMLWKCTTIGRERGHQDNWNRSLPCWSQRSPLQLPLSGLRAFLSTSTPDTSLGNNSSIPNDCNSESLSSLSTSPRAVSSSSSSRPVEMSFSPLSSVMCSTSSPPGRPSL